MFIKYRTIKSLSKPIWLYKEYILLYKEFTNDKHVEEKHKRTKSTHTWKLYKCKSVLMKCSKVSQEYSFTVYLKWNSKAFDVRAPQMKETKSQFFLVWRVILCSFKIAECINLATTFDTVGICLISHFHELVAILISKLRLRLRLHQLWELLQKG